MLAHNYRQVGGRLRPLPMQRASALLALSAAVLLQAHPRPVSAHEDPAGCHTASATISLTLYYNNGTDSPGPGGSVSPCETVKYKGSLRYPPGSCSFEGGRLTLTTPDGKAMNVTPPGGIPKLGGVGGKDGVDSALVTYTVRPEDSIAGVLTSSITYMGGIAHVGPSDAPNLPLVGTAFNNFVEPCPLTASCITLACDASRTDGTRQGLCSADQMEFQQAGTGCPDTDNNPCTAARCDGAGHCDQTQDACDDHNPCTRDSCDPATGCRHDAIPGCQSCGNGILEAGEECDEGTQNGDDASCCSHDCMLRRPTYVCHFAPTVCLEDATCSGSTGACPSNGFASPDRECDDADPCTINDHCQAGVCVGGGKVCDVVVKLSRATAVPALAVSCVGTPAVGRGAFCTATAFVTGAASTPRSCILGSSNEVQITKLKRRALHRGRSAFLLKLNPCGRSLFRGLKSGLTISASVVATLSGVQTGEQEQQSVTLARTVDLTQ